MIFHLTMADTKVNYEGIYNFLRNRHEDSQEKLFFSLAKF